ncbi:MAG TPA: formate/nitrite transporter family protein [Solirubrobacteraceae bacterium]|jgi:formate/nitrite transporter FocA (FNT family)|nr:formate/nitrite transporter family protein [Solirubrobacteraceae bacterium]
MADELAPEPETEQPEEAPEPHEMFARTREEGERRLTRSALELATTSLVAGFDVVFGVVALAAATAAMAPHFGPSAAHFFGSLFFGIAFIFIVVGRSELFTENFLVPITALRRGRLSVLKLAQLWTISPVLNIAGGTALILILSSKGVLPEGAAPALVDVAEHIGELSHWSAFLSAVAGGALITVMTWMVEGVGTVGGRIVVAWIAGVLLALGSFNHVIVVTLELIFGMRFGADVGLDDTALNFVIAVAGNMLGGLLFVTLTRTSQAVGSGDSRSPTR